MNFIIKLWIQGFSIQKTKITSKLIFNLNFLFILNNKCSTQFFNWYTWFTYYKFFLKLFSSKLIFYIREIVKCNFVCKFRYNFSFLNTETFYSHFYNEIHMWIILRISKRFQSILFECNFFFNVALPRVLVELCRFFQ